MVEQEYSYITIKRDEGKISLGEYTDDVAHMHGEVLGLPELGHDDPEDLQAELEASCEDWLAAIVVSNKNNEVVGYGALSRAADKSEEVELSYAYVRPQDRRRGIYKQLLSRRIDIARQLGAAEVQTQPMSDTFHPSFLMREGFTGSQDETGVVIYRRKI
ncbi:MAG TPA: GNAT family N-acetyltransferase [Patescibacteria group bacterium]|nr:GNAT family N-acetyltransferase [Patescibacteria group bacterium]